MKNRVKMDLQQIQKAEYDILDFFDKKCKDLNIQYSLAYGTLLGAVRHSGFIPWDDDVDVCMDRENYERFLLSFDDEGGRYRLFNCRRDGNKCNVVYAKIVDTYTSAKEGKVDNGDDYGLWIDIFCIDYVPQNILQRKITVGFFYFINQIKKTKVLNNPSLLYRVIGLIFGWASVSFLAKLIDNYGRKAKKSNYAMNLSFITKRNINRYFSPEQLADYTEIQFCDRMFPCFKKYKEVLELLYGNNYMELPPVSQRQTHYIDAYMKTE